MTITSDNILLSHRKISTNKRQKRIRSLPQALYFRSCHINLFPFNLCDGNQSFARAFYHGDFTFGNIKISTNGLSPFLYETSHIAWKQELHSFVWLKHMFAAHSHVGLASTRNMILDWIRLQPRSSHKDSLPWNLNIVTQRCLAWLQYSAWLIQGSTIEFQTVFLQSLRQQIIYLYKNALHIRDEHDRTILYLTIKYATRILDCTTLFKNKVNNLLSQQLKIIILPDGGHIFRNPQYIYNMLSLLLPLRQSYINDSYLPPTYLIETIERLLPALRFFLHKNRQLAHFNGAQPISTDSLERLLELDDTQGKVFHYMPHSGFYRLSNQDVTVLCDTGTVLDTNYQDRAHAGCLSFEFSAFQQKIVVNSGSQAQLSPKDLFNSRQSFAHSTAQIDDMSSCSFRKKLFKSQYYVSQLDKIIVHPIQKPNIIGFRAGHSGFEKRTGFLHVRELLLSHNGECLEGTDNFIKSERKVHYSTKQITLRFHLHPDLKISYRNNGFLLIDRDNHCWAFQCTDLPASLEDSIYYDEDGIRPNQQIVLYFSPKTHQQISWKFIQIKDRSLI